MHSLLICGQFDVFIMFDPTLAGVKPNVFQNFSFRGSKQILGLLIVFTMFLHIFSEYPIRQ